MAFCDVTNTLTHHNHQLITKSSCLQVVYHAINSTILLLLSSPPTPLLYRCSIEPSATVPPSDLDTMLGAPLSDLSADLTLQWSGAREANQAQDQVRMGPPTFLTVLTYQTISNPLQFPIDQLHLSILPPSLLARSASSTTTRRTSR